MPIAVHTLVVSFRNNSFTVNYFTTYDAIRNKRFIGNVHLAKNYTQHKQ